MLGLSYRDFKITTHVKGARGRQFARTDGRISALILLLSSVLLVSYARNHCQGRESSHLCFPLGVPQSQVLHLGF